MAIWKTEPVSQQPTLTLRSWRVNELPDGDRHLAGYCVENREGRVSSPIDQFDPEERIVITRSGRAYRLDGQPGHHPDAEYVWNIWIHAYGIDEVSDVTNEFAEAVANTRRENGSQNGTD